MPEKMEPRSTSYGALQSGDVIVDKSGNEWLVLDHASTEVDEVAFWLADPATKVRAHYLTKRRAERATVLRPATHAAKLDVDDGDHTDRRLAEEIAENEAVAVIEEQLGGEVIAEETAAEADARTAATDESPVVLPTFDEMTDLEKRSHLYLLHGVYAADVKFREKLVELHDEAHGIDRLGVPHTHVEGAPVPDESDES